MKKIILAFVVVTALLSCNKSNENVEVVEKDNDSALVLEKDSVNAIPEDSTKVPINQDGPLFVSNGGTYKFRIISKKDSKSPHKILLRNEFSGRIYSMERLIVPNGEKYQDLDDNFFIIKNDSFFFGNKKKIIASGKVSKSNPIGEPARDSL